MAIIKRVMKMRVGNNKVNNKKNIDNIGNNKAGN